MKPVRYGLLVAIAFAFSASLSWADCEFSYDCTGCCGGSGWTTCTSIKNCTLTCGEGSCAGCGFCEYACSGHKPYFNLTCCGGCVVLGDSPTASATGHSTPCVDAKLTTVSFVPLGKAMEDTRDVEVHLEVSADVPVEIVDLEFEPSAEGLKSGKYRIRNLSHQGLVAFEVGWQLYFGDEAKVLKAFHSTDFWMTKQAQLGPGETDAMQFPEYHGLGPLRRAVGTVDYAEFSDGTRVGPRATEEFPRWTAVRVHEHDLYQALLSTYSQGGASALEEALSPSLARSESGLIRSWRSEFRVSYQQDPDAAMQELKRVAALKVPQ
ncbi:MAG: hypothetical protein ABSF71_24230 [Terriglobia bacterium]